MVKSKIAVSLAELCKHFSKVSKLSYLIRFIEKESENEEFYEDNDLDLIRGCIHELYSISDYYGRSSLLRICCNLEIQSEIDVFESFHFDQLVCLSLERRQPDPVPKIDEEKTACFRIIMSILKIWGYLPNSIIRSLVFLYHQQKHSFKPLIIGCLCESIVLSDSVFQIPEATNTLIDYCIENADSNICSLICYCIEKGDYKDNFPHILSRFVWPLSHLGAVERNLIEGSCRCIISILRTWP